MCVSCGCGKPSESHGNADHIVIHDLERAAEAANISVRQVAENIKKSVDDYTARSRPSFQQAPVDAGPG